MMRKITAILAILLFAASAGHSERYVGGDISLLPEYEKAGAQYKTHDGEKIAEVLPWFKEEGMNAMRVRLFVDPANGKDPNACQSLEYILPLCKRIKDTGFKLMLDFHYSDTWADPVQQYTPKAWSGLDDEQLEQKIYEYTRDCLNTLKEAGAAPDFIQPGNEISYGMLWGPEGTASSDLKKVYINNPANWERFGKLLNQAVKACHEVCPAAKIVLHTERVANVLVMKNFYTKMEELDVPYDIIGLSYYPYFHGGMSVLNTALSTLEENYPGKDIMIVETGYSYKWEVPGTTIDLTNTWPYSDEGQNQFAKDLVATLEAHSRVTGLFWWWMEYNACNTSLTNWYNAPLFDSLTGRATSALETICSFAQSSAVQQVECSDCDSKAQYFTIDGKPLSGEPGNGIFIKRENNKSKKIIK